MKKISMNAQEFRSVASIGNVCSSDDMIPMLAAIHLTVFHDNVVAVATDRYRLARVKFPSVEPSEDFDILIDAKPLMKFWASIKTVALKSSQNITLQVSDDDSSWEISYDGSSISGARVYGSYPAVGKLVDEARDRKLDGTSKISLLPSFVGDLAKIYHPKDDRRFDVKSAGWDFTLTANGNGKNEPVYATRGDDTHGSVEYLLQPRMAGR
jgi:hypothetical protein